MAKTTDKLPEKIPEKTLEIAETKFTIKQLRENCRKLFNVTKAVFDGATYKLKGEYTKAEMQEIINKWRKRVD